MPKISVWLIRLALLSLIVGWSIGSILLASRGMIFWSWAWYLRPLHIELLLFGWMVQLAFGVASWILPRTASRSGSRPLVITLVALNAGVWLAGIAEAIGTSWLVAAGRILEVVAVLTFAWYIWPRVRSFRE